jgi:hypothetical protein
MSTDIKVDDAAHGSSPRNQWDSLTQSMGDPGAQAPIKHEATPEAKVATRRTISASGSTSAAARWRGIHWDGAPAPEPQDAPAGVEQAQVGGPLTARQRFGGVPWKTGKAPERDTKHQEEIAEQRAEKLSLKNFFKDVKW